MPDYTFSPAPVLVEATGEFAIGATGVLRPVAGGNAVQVYDLNGSPLPNITVGPKGACQAFKADIPDGILDFGSVLLTAISQESLTAALSAQQAAEDAASSAAQAAADADAAAAAAAGKADLVDGVVPGAQLPSRLSDAELRAAFGSAGANLGRFLKRAQAGDTLKLVALGDSVLEGTTVDNPATDDTMHLLPVDLAARFPASTFTAVNHAVSSYTTAASFVNGKVAAAVAAQADLYDIGWDIAAPTALPVPGYARETSLAMLELMVRIIRAEVPKADIVLLGTNPYSPISHPSNDELYAWQVGSRRVAAAHGCEYVDGYAPFAAAPNLPALVPDATHPGTAGHRLLANTILDHLPADYAGPALTPDAGQGGIYPKDVDTTTALRGWRQLTATATGQWVNVGTGWTGSNPYVTSTATDYAEFTFNGSQLLLTISTATADAPVVDVTVDGSPLYTNRSLAQGKNGPQYLVPIVTGLSAAAHTVRVTLKSGTLRLFKAANTVAGGDYTPTVAVIDLTTVPGAATQSTTSLDSAGATHYMVLDYDVPLPTGWTRMAVTFTGYVVARVTGTTTTERLVNVNLRLDGTGKQVLQRTFAPVATAAATDLFPFIISHTEASATAAVRVRYEARVQSTDKTGVARTSWSLQAACHRLG